jgi:hypothetical protein
MKVLGWMIFSGGLALILGSLLVPGAAQPSEIETTSAHLSALLGDGAREAEFREKARSARETANIMLLCGIGAAIAGPIFIVAGIVGNRSKHG